jgi:4-hydroxybenzoate polyprenyltransferase
VSGLARRAHLMIVVVRPAVLLIFGLFAMVGMAAAGPRQGDRSLPVVGLVLVLVSFLVFSVTLNDIADVRIDRVNLGGDRRRPLVVGAGTSTEFAVMAASSASLALSGALLVSWAAVAVVAFGLAVSASYSLRPVRLADRGTVASLVLPACYVAVPFLLGEMAVGGRTGTSQLMLLVGLYLGFVGRIVMKDFRDVRGDAMFGKRTFLVRHGRRATVRFSAAFIGVGTAVIVAAAGRSVGWAFLYLVLYGAMLLDLHRLGRDEGHRRDERRISALAVLCRGMVVLVLLQLEMAGRSAPVSRFTGGERLIVAAAFVAITLGQASTMARYGPRPTRLRPPSLLSGTGPGSGDRAPLRAQAAPAVRAIAVGAVTAPGCERR